MIKNDSKYADAGLNKKDPQKNSALMLKKKPLSSDYWIFTSKNGNFLNSGYMLVDFLPGKFPGVEENIFESIIFDLYLIIHIFSKLT